MKSKPNKSESQKRLYELLGKLNERHKLDDFEKTEARLLARDLKYNLSENQALYLGASKTHSNLKIAFIVILFVAVVAAFVSYIWIYSKNTRQAYQKIYEDKVKLEKDLETSRHQYDELNKNYKELGVAANNILRDYNQIKDQKNNSPVIVQQPSTPSVNTYVAPVQYPKTSRCYSDFLGSGFTCTTY